MNVLRKDLMAWRVQLGTTLPVFIYVFQVQPCQFRYLHKVGFEHFPQCSLYITATTCVEQECKKKV